MTHQNIYNPLKANVNTQNPNEMHKPLYQNTFERKFITNENLLL